MAEIQRSVLFGKLNSVGYKSLESATVFCKMRGNPYVELVHWVQQILQLQDSDLHRIVKYFEIDSSRLAADVTTALDRLPRGSTSISDLSSHLDETMERIKVVPNPYIMTNSMEPAVANKYLNQRRRIMFTHIPARCEIRIFTSSGILVDKIDVDNTSSDGSMTPKPTTIQMVPLTSDSSPDSPTS